MKSELGYQFNKDPQSKAPEAGERKDPWGLLDIESEGTNAELLDHQIEKTFGQLAEEETVRDPFGIRNVEVAEVESKKISFRELWDRAKDKIVDITPNFIISEDKIVNAYVESVNRSIKLSKSAGRFYSLLAKHGHTKPDKEHVFKETNSALKRRGEGALSEIYAIRGLYTRKSQMLRAEHVRISQYDIEKLTEKPIYRSSEQRNGYKFEVLAQVVNQAGGHNTVEEVVGNNLFEDWNYCATSLFIHNKETGDTLELNELLPAGFIFMPAEMGEVKRRFIEEGEGDNKAIKSENILVPVTLEAYNGNQTAEDTFYENATLERVGYGHLDKKGDLLTLLHEIAHAWQSKYHSNKGRANWERFYRNVTLQLEMLQRFTKLHQESRGESPDDKRSETTVEEEEEWEFDWAKRKLAEVGVSIGKDYIYTNQELGGDKFKISSLELEVKDENLDFKRNDFYIQSDKAKPLIEDFIREERDAWAHALRVLRFLRQRGFDLEPELKSLKDIQDMIHHCLGTYQANLQTQIEPNEHIRKFTQKSGLDIEEYANKLRQVREESITGSEM